MPEEWEEDIYVALHKKGAKTDCSNFRGLCILAVAYKIIAKILYRRLLQYHSNIVGEYQSGFTPGKSTIDNIISLCQMREKYWEYNKDLWHVFVDFKQYYDSVHRTSMWNI